MPDAYSWTVQKNMFKRFVRRRYSAINDTKNAASGVTLDKMR
jgi:hypothetical protein